MVGRNLIPCMAHSIVYKTSLNKGYTIQYFLSHFWSHDIWTKISGPNPYCGFFLRINKYTIRFRFDVNNDGINVSGLDIFIKWHFVCDKHRIYMPWYLRRWLYPDWWEVKRHHISTKGIRMSPACARKYQAETKWPAFHRCYFQSIFNVNFTEIYFQMSIHNKQTPVKNYGVV